MTGRFAILPFSGSRHPLADPAKGCALSPRRQPAGGDGAGGDDLREMRGAQSAVRRGERRCARRPVDAIRQRAERLTRRYTCEISRVIARQDIPAPDVGTNAQVMAWMMDTWSRNAGTAATGVVTGKPVHLGGSLGRAGTGDRARRVYHRLSLHCGKNGTPRGAKPIAVQGFGNG